MSKSVGELLAGMLSDIGATRVSGILGDALNSLTEAISQDERVAWLGVRHKEGAALAAAGLLAGALAATVYELFCQETAALISAIWYSLGIMLNCELGAVLGARVLRG